MFIRCLCSQIIILTKKHVESPGNWLEKHAEYVFTRFDSVNAGMTHHKLYVL